MGCRASLMVAQRLHLIKNRSFCKDCSRFIRTSKAMVQVLPCSVLEDHPRFLILLPPCLNNPLDRSSNQHFCSRFPLIFAAFPLCAYKQTAHQGYLRYTNMNALVVLRICLKLDRLGSQIVQASLPWFVKGYMSHVILLILILFSFRIGKTVSQSSSCGAKAC